MQRPVVRFKDLIEKHLAFVGENNIVNTEPDGKQRRLGLPVGQPPTIITLPLAFKSSTPSSFNFVAPSMTPPLTAIVWQEYLFDLRGQRRTSVYQALIDRRAVHGEVVRLDLTVVGSHGEVLYPPEVGGGGIVSRVAQGVFEAGLLLGEVEPGGGVGVTARKRKSRNSVTGIVIALPCRGSSSSSGRGRRREDQKKKKRKKRRCCRLLPNLSSWRRLFVDTERMVSKAT